MDIDISKLSIGDHHYMAYVGSPLIYDIIGASQFRLLCTLGLRSYHRVLDFGCGSLRAGRFFICYLNEGCYYGIDPNKWLIEDAIKNQIGDDLIRIKKPLFSYNDDFTVGQFTNQFDYIIAQSIFSHAGSELVLKCLQSLSNSLAPDGIIAASFMEGAADFVGSEWIYPEVITFRRSTIIKYANRVGLHATPIQWFHPTLTWFLFSKQKGRLPHRIMRIYLHGAVLFDPEFNGSWSPRDKIIFHLNRLFKRAMPEKLQEPIRSLIAPKKRK